MTCSLFIRAWLRTFLVASALSSAGCGNVVVDTESEETVVHEEPPCGNAPVCTPGANEVEICAGAASLHERTCDEACAWSAWSDCGAITNCIDGDTQDVACGDHGKQPFVCEGGVWTAAGSCFVPEWLSIDAGIFHTCGVRANGKIVCWGSNLQGQSAPPKGTFKAVSAAGYDTCALRDDGTVTCWGSLAEGIAETPEGSFERLNLGMGQGCLMKGLEATCWGDETYNQSAIPPGEYLAVDSGVRDGCGVRTDHALRCWGNNFYSIEDDMPKAAIFTTVSVGEGHACALDLDGHPHCWGRNDYAQASGAPTEVVLTQISAGAEHTCGIDGAGEIHCWGWNAYGQLEAPIGPFVQVTGGEYHNCALDPQGKAVCWGGDNSHGEHLVPPL